MRLMLHRASLIASLVTVTSSTHLRDDFILPMPRLKLKTSRQEATSRPRLVRKRSTKCSTQCNFTQISSLTWWTAWSIQWISSVASQMEHLHSAQYARWYSAFNCSTKAKVDQAPQPIGIALSRKNLASKAFVKGSLSSNSSRRNKRSKPSKISSMRWTYSTILRRKKSLSLPLTKPREKSANTIDAIARTDQTLSSLVRPSWISMKK